MALYHWVTQLQSALIEWFGSTERSLQGLQLWGELRVTNPRCRFLSERLSLRGTIFIIQAKAFHIIDKQHACKHHALKRWFLSIYRLCHKKLFDFRNDNGQPKSKYGPFLINLISNYESPHKSRSRKHSSAMFLCPISLDIRLSKKVSASSTTSMLSNRTGFGLLMLWSPNDRL